jgi:Phage ABA sandwich domain
MNLREIDRLVAEKVMGWEYHEAVYTWGELFSPAKYVKEDGREVEPFNLPHFSTNIADALQVVEKLRDRYVYMNLTNNDDSYCCELMEQDLENSSRYFTYYADAETAPLAICLAALKAVGVEVEGMDNEQ